MFNAVIFGPNQREELKFPIEFKATDENIPRIFVGFSPEGLPDGVAAQVDDLQHVVSGAGQQLAAVVVQVQRRHPAQQLHLPHDALRPDGAA